MKFNLCLIHQWNISAAIASPFGQIDLPETHFPYFRKSLFLKVDGNIVNFENGRGFHKYPQNGMKSFMLVVQQPLHICAQIFSENFSILVVLPHVRTLVT